MNGARFPRCVASSNDPVDSCQIAHNKTEDSIGLAVSKFPESDGEYDDDCEST